MNILAIESSADETAAAVVKDGTTIISNVISSSAEMNKKYGGIVPEVAAREQLAYIIPTITEALRPLSPTSSVDYQKIIHDSIDVIAVTVGPGLIGSLLIGVETAKTIAFVTKKPLIPVNHVLAHIYANFVTSSIDTSKKIQFPAISLVVSGGHTELFLMKSKKDLLWLGGTLDDAAGEAFDKTARLLGFGTGGGVAIQEAAKKFQVSNLKFQIKLPRPMMHEDNLTFSFSGLKAAIVREWSKYTDQPEDLKNAFAYEVQEAITDVLVKKTLKAAAIHSAKSILISGGVSANIRLREKFQSSIKDRKLTIKFFSPPIALSTDNAAYIASYAFFRGESQDWHSITAQPDLSVETISQF
jgi:N6-L-threonylcarbamoyladenine synthase